jgi:cell division protein FtsB
MTLKQKVTRVVFGIEIVVVLGFYFFGTQGIMALMQLKKELQRQEHDTSLLAEDIKKLEYEYESWKNDPFYVEKHAREKLAMARDGEKIYVTRVIDF